MIYHINQKINKQKLINEYYEIKNSMSEFSKLNETWKKTHQVGIYGNELIEMYGNKLSGKVVGGYYFQKANTSILPHRDSRCGCRINIRLTDDDGVMTINNSKEPYDFALINVKDYIHEVSMCTVPRLLFSIIYLSDEFDKVRSTL